VKAEWNNLKPFVGTQRVTNSRPERLAERTQLFQLALRQPVIDATSQCETVSPRLQQMLDHSATMPAFVMGRRWDVLAWNQAESQSPAGGGCFVRHG
jgi:MmyB-like transcription regulator ligand binding domain